MKVRDLMTAEVFSLRPEHRLDLVDDLMSLRRIRHIPVVDDEERLVGLVTHRDLLRASVSSLARISERDQRDLYGRVRVGDVMRTDVITISPDEELKTAAARMIDGKIGCLPVVESGRLVGILTEADFLALAWECMCGEGAT